MKTGLIITNLCLGSFRPYSAMSCVNPYEVAESILKVHGLFDIIFIVNDEHRPDDREFNNLPPHMIIGTDDVYRLPHIERQLTDKPLEFLKKNTADATWKRHNNMLIESYCCDEICVAGFTASHDVLATVSGLVEFGKKVVIIEECIGDIDMGLKQDAILHLRSINIPVITLERFISNAKR